MSSPGGGDALRSGAVVNVELGGAARQARMALQVELAGGIIAAVAGDAAAVELRIGTSNAAGQRKDHRREQAICA